MICVLQVNTEDRFNAPTNTDEIAVIYVIQTIVLKVLDLNLNLNLVLDLKVRFRDLILNLKSGGDHTFSELNSCVDSLVYPLCLPYGSSTDSRDYKRSPSITMGQYYRCRSRARTGNRVILLLYLLCILY